MKLPVLTLTALALTVLPSKALDLIGYWNFNGQSDDQTANGANATLLDGAAISADGLGFSGTAGDSSLDVGVSGNGATISRAEATVDLSGATANNSMAVSFWQYDIGDGAGANVATTTFGFNSSSGGGTRGFQTHSPWIDGTLYFDHGGACCGGGNRLTFSVGTSLLDGWHHIVLQVDNGNKQIWVDGTMVNEQPAGAAAIPTFTGQLAIGAEPAGINGFGGRIDEFAIWDESLTSGQITRLSNGEAASALIDTTDADADDLLDSFEQLIIDADPNDAIETIADVLPGDDFDNDDLTNLEEQTAETDPTNPDTDGDDLLDGVETGGGTYTSPSNTGTDPLDADSDDDGLEDGVENPNEDFVDINTPGTNPNLPDTDGDGFDDKLEIDNGSDPTDPNSVLGSDELELLGYWDFDDNTDPASVPEITGNSPAAAIVTPAAFSADAGGHSGNPGDRSLDLGISANMAGAQVPTGDHLKTAQFNNEFAISFWQKNTGITSASSSFWFTPGRSIQAHVPWSDGTLYFDHSYTAANAPARFTIPNTVGGGLLVADQWQHLLLQKDAAGNRQIYIDGVLQGEEASGNANPVAALDGGITIGAANNLGNGFPGSLDEFAVFSRILSQEQVTRLATGTPASEILQPAAPFVITALTIGEDGRVSVTFNARPNQDYAVEVSADLKNWSELTDNERSDTGSVTYKDEITEPGTPRLYYRAEER